MHCTWRLYSQVGDYFDAQDRVGVWWFESELAAADGTKTFKISSVLAAILLRLANSLCFMPPQQQDVPALMTTKLR